MHLWQHFNTSAKPNKEYTLFEWKRHHRSITSFKMRCKSALVDILFPHLSHDAFSVRIKVFIWFRCSCFSYSFILLALYFSLFFKTDQSIERIQWVIKTYEPLFVCHFVYACYCVMTHFIVSLFIVFTISRKQNHNCPPIQSERKEKERLSHLFPDICISRWL